MLRLFALFLLSTGVFSSSLSPVEEPPLPKTVVERMYDSFTVRSTTRTRSLTSRMKILYPVLQAPDAVAPLPVVVYLGGWFMESNRYQWMGERLVRDCGIVWVAVDTLVDLAGRPSLTSIGGSVFDTINPAHGLTTILKKLGDFNKRGPLKGRLDLNRIIFGGHSWGGRTILVGDSRWTGLPSNVIGVFVYAAHAERAFVPGFLPGSMIKLKGTAPLLLMIGNRDHVMQSRFPSASKSAVEAVRRTFRYSVRRKRRCYFVEFDGFNHMSGVFPEDNTIRTARFDGVPLHDKGVMTDEIYRVVSLFVEERLNGDGTASGELQRHLFEEKNRRIKHAARKG